MSKLDLFSASFLCSHQTVCPHCPNVHLLTHLRSYFIQVPYTWFSKMRFRVGSSQPLYFLEFMDAALLCFSCRRTCDSLHPWCWFAPSCQRYMISLRIISWNNWGKTRWILRHLLPWIRSLVLSRHKCWHLRLLGGRGLLEFWPLLPDCW